MISPLVEAVKSLYAKYLGHDKTLTDLNSRLKAESAAKDKEIKELKDRLDKLEKLIQSK